MGNLSHSVAHPMDDSTSTPSILTLPDLQRCDYAQLLADPPTLAYHEMHTRLLMAVEPAQAAGDAAKAAALTLLANICSMMLRPADRAAPFQPMMVLADGRRTMLDHDLTDADVTLLASFAPDVQHDLLRARLADLVWHKDRKQGVGFARMAIDGYRMHPVSEDAWHVDGQACWHRALQLAASIGNDAAVAEIEATLLDAFRRAVEAQSKDALWYLRPLYAERCARSHADDIAGQLEQLGRKQLQDQHLFAAEMSFDMARLWYGRSTDKDKAVEMQTLSAACWERQGDADTSGIGSVHHYAKAIASYRTVPSRYRPQYGVDDIIAGLRAKLLATGKRAVDDMSVASHSFDVSDVVQEATQAVRGLSPSEALITFCRLIAVPKTEALRTEAIKKVSGIAGVSDVSVMDGDGRVVAHKPGVLDGADAREQRIVSEMVDYCAIQADIMARSVLAPALDSMKMEVQLTPQDFYQLVRISDLVPPDRADLVGKGLHAGYCRDLEQSLHILLPQFEHMVRVVLKEAGALTTHHENGIDMELGLSRLTELPEMATAFGEDLTFTLRALMCVADGPNLRNKIAHGLVGSAQCNSGYGLYVWWLILRLVAHSYILMIRSEQANATSSGTDK
jgi:hypothetical protein